MRPKLLSLLLLVACNGDQQFQSLKSDIVVLPTSLEFGEVVVGESATGTLQIKNTGRNDLELTGASLAGTDGVFSWDLPETVLIPDDNLALDITFSPTDLLVYADTLTLSNNDPDTPEFPIPLTGTGRAAPVPDIALSTTSIDFGDVEPGAQGMALLSVANEGELDLEIDLTSLEGAGTFTLSDDLEGTVLSPGNQSTIFVYYDPFDDSGDQATLSIASNDPDENPVEIELIGNGGGALDYPVAVLDCPTGVEPRTSFTLDASGSTDPSGLTPLTYTWSLATTPDGSAATLSATDSAADIYVDLAGDYTISVSVTNTAGVSSAPAKCNLEVAPADDIHVELVWDTENSDLDLHLADDAAELYAVPGDVSLCNMTPDWGIAAETLDDPSLDLYDEDGYGPESIGIDEPAEGQYTVRVHYFEDNGVLEGTGGGATVATVRIWVRGVMEEESSLMLTRNEVWDVGIIRWAYGYVVMNEDPEASSASRRSCPEE